MLANFVSWVLGRCVLTANVSGNQFEDILNVRVAARVQFLKQFLVEVIKVTVMEVAISIIVAVFPINLIRVLL